MPESDIAVIRIAMAGRTVIIPAPVASRICGQLRRRCIFAITAIRARPARAPYARASGESASPRIFLQLLAGVERGESLLAVLGDASRVPGLNE